MAATYRDIALPFLSALGDSAKQHPRRKFRRLYETMCRMDVLREAWRQARANDGSPGIDGLTFRAIEEGPEGVAGFLEELQADLEAGRYRPQPVRRVFIPKPGKPGQLRPLGVPCIRDRVAQTAAKLVLEPIFEARFVDCSFGFRPGRSAIQALDAAREAVDAGNVFVGDADVEGFFDNLDHQKLLWLLDEHVWDQRMRKLVRKWLEAGLVYHGKHEATGKGTPQGGPASPLLANLYLHYFDRAWRSQGRGLGQLVRYADDFIVLCPSQQAAVEALAAVRAILGRLGLRVNEGKTRIVDLNDPEQGFDFLGYAHRLKPDARRQGHKRLHRWPGTKATKRIGERVKAILLDPTLPPEPKAVVGELNAVIRGWGAYFRWGDSQRIFSKVDNYVRRRFALFLVRKYGRRGTGWSWRTPAGRIMTIYRFLKLLGLYQLRGTERPWAVASAPS
jgi:RNA-directed DNA polymerase